MTGAVVEKVAWFISYTPGVLGGRAKIALHHVDSVHDFMGICHIQDDAEIMVSCVLSCATNKNV